MAAAKYTLTIEKGATFRRTFRRKRKADDTEISLDGCTVRMKIRQPKWNGDVVEGFDLSTAHSPPEITISTDPDHVGTFTIEVSADVTAAVPADVCKGVYDIEVEDSDGFVKRILEGDVRFSPEVTRPDSSGD